MSVIRIKHFYPVELVTRIVTIGRWPFRETDDGEWMHTETGERYVGVSLREALESLSRIVSEK